MSAAGSFRCLSQKLKNGWRLVCPCGMINTLPALFVAFLDIRKYKKLKRIFSIYSEILNLFSEVNSTRVTILESNVPLQPPQTPNWTDIYGNINWVKEFRSCPESHYPVVRMECHNYGKTLNNLVSF